MHQFKRSLIAVAVAMTSVSTVKAAEHTEFWDPSISGKIQTVYFDEKTINNGTQYMGAWTAALMLTAETGYMFDMVEVGVTGFGVGKLHMPDKNKGDSDGLLKGDGNSFARLGQAWVDVKLPESMPVQANVLYGYKEVETGMVTILGNRSVPNTYLGLDSSISFAGFTGGLAWINKVAQLDDSKYYNLKNGKGNKIDWAIAIGAAYKFELTKDQSLQFQYNNAIFKDYVVGNNFAVNYNGKFDGDWTVGANVNVYYAKAKQGTNSVWQWESQRPFDDSATSSSLDVELGYKGATVTVGVTYNTASTSGENGDYNTLGQYNYNLAANTQLAYNVVSNAIYSAFSFDKELVLFGGLAYDFGQVGLEGLSLSYIYFHGGNMHAVNTKTGAKTKISESESDIALSYQFPQKYLKGLNATVHYAYYNNDELFRTVTGQPESRDLRMWLSYNFDF